MRLLLLTLSLLASGCDCGGTLGRDRDGSIDGSRADGGLASDIVILGPGVPSDAPSRFARPPVDDATRAASVLYPLDEVLFPRNVYSPDVQWNEVGVMGDLYRVSFTGAPISLTAYVIHSGTPFRFDYLVDYDAWRDLTDAAAGARMTLTVDRWDSAANEIVSGVPIQVRIARSGIAGAVYYWELGSFGSTQGRIVRVRQGTETVPTIENFMPQPPPNATGDRCAACHGLSRDGNRLAVAFDDGNFGGVVDLTTDLSGADPPMIFRFSQPWFFAAFSPDSSRLFMTDTGQSSFLLDGTSGAPIVPSTGALPSATHPAWSPDGMQIAMIRGADDAWNPTTGNLATMAVTGADQFGGPAMLHDGSTLSGAPEGGTLDMYPSYSPDSSTIAFGHGTHTLLSADGARGALYLIASGGGNAVRLDRASEGDAYYPNFTPFTTTADDGSDVWWLLLYSPRDYGNSLAGTQGTRRRQIWVTAISTDASAGDPSNAPYWLPGQETAQENASAYWAPLPCRDTGESCSAGGQCCSGACDPDSFACQPVAGCRMEGETCSEDADCCDATLACAGGACVDAPI